MQPKSNLEVVLDKIASQKEVQNANTASRLSGEDIDVSKDLHFMIGTVKYMGVSVGFKYFRVKFSSGDKKCVITLSDDNDPLFIFDDPDEIQQIRVAIVAKHAQMLENEKKQQHKDFMNI